jgi:hypothetical protein
MPMLRSKLKLKPMLKSWLKPKLETNMELQYIVCGLTF